MNIRTYRFKADDLSPAGKRYYKSAKAVLGADQAQESLRKRFEEGNLKLFVSERFYNV